MSLFPNRTYQSKHAATGSMDQQGLYCLRRIDDNKGFARRHPAVKVQRIGLIVNCHRIPPPDSFSVALPPVADVLAPPAEFDLI